MLYTKLPKYCKDMSKDELLVFFPRGTTLKTYASGLKKGQTYKTAKYTTAFMMRTLIMNELEHCDKSETRTLRGVWYSAIKPTLDKLGLLQDDDTSEEGLKRWDATLSSYVCDLLRRGALTFSDLGISDISRQKKNPREHFYTVGGREYAYKGTIAPYPNILIATEKDTVYTIIESIAQLYGCSAISCKGQNSLGAMESIVKGMFQTDPKVHFSTIYVLTLTDYDPAGYYIAEALEKQVNDILYAIGKSHIAVHTHRLGITPDQLSEEQVRQNMYSPKKANIEKWMARTNGINGQEKGLELDAFSATQIREIFIENLAEFIDHNVYKDFIKESYIKMQILESIKTRLSKMTKKVTNEIIDDLEMKDFDMVDYGIRGYSSLDIEDLCEDNLDDKIKKLANQYM